MSKVLIICGPTATGKTGFALEAAVKFNGELVSADSRQVYAGMDIVTGKDIPKSSRSLTSKLVWNQRPLKFYKFENTRIWLYDVVNPDEPFSVSHWKSCVDLIIADIRHRHKLPIVVGGTGLYLKALTQSLDKITIPPNPQLRRVLADKPAGFLFEYLQDLNPASAVGLNSSDRCNSRRLLRAIEIAVYRPQSVPSKTPSPATSISPPEAGHNWLQVGLTASRDYLNSRIDQRVDNRISIGAEKEAADLLAKYDHPLPSLSASGYRAFTAPDPVSKWKILEHQYAKRQLTWFRSQPGIIWFDISDFGWKPRALGQIDSWYNKFNVHLPEN